MGLVSAFTDLVCVLRREYSMSDEVREALAIALDFLVKHDYLMKPSKSYLSAAKQCGVRADLTPVDRWSSSEDAPLAEVISAPRTMSSGPCATSHASSAKAPAAAGARASGQQSAPRPNAGNGPQTMAQRVRSSTPPATGRQRLGQAMADFGQSAASRGLSPAVCEGRCHACLRPLAEVPLLVLKDPRSMHLWSRAHPCLKRQVQTHRTMGVRGGALPRIVRSRTLGPRFRREGQLRVPG